MTSGAQDGFRLTESPGRLQVSGVLGFDTATAAFKAIQAALNNSDVAELDLAGIDRCDSAGLACVLAVVAEQQRRGRSLKVANMPAGTQALAQVCEVSSLLA